MYPPSSATRSSRAWATAAGRWPTRYVSAARATPRSPIVLPVCTSMRGRSTSATKVARRYVSCCDALRRSAPSNSRSRSSSRPERRPGRSTGTNALGGVARSQLHDELAIERFADSQQCVDPRRTSATLQARDRRLSRSGQLGELPLREPAGEALLGDLVGDLSKEPTSVSHTCDALQCSLLQTFERSLLGHRRNIAAMLFKRESESSSCPDRVACSCRCGSLLLSTARPRASRTRASPGSRRH